MKTILNIASLAASVLCAAHAAHAQQIPIDGNRVLRPIAGEINAYRAAYGGMPLPGMQVPFVVPFAPPIRARVPRTTCKSGYVWRLAGSTDLACVTPDADVRSGRM